MPSWTLSNTSRPVAPSATSFGKGIYEHDREDGSENLVAILCWAGAAKRLKDRDRWIGWDGVTCAYRLKLAVQLRRFLVPAQSRRSGSAAFRRL